MAKSRSSLNSISRPGVRNSHWYAFGAGCLACGLSAAAILSDPLSPVFLAGWDAERSGFVVNAADEMLAETPTFIDGISGETFAAGDRHIARMDEIEGVTIPAEPVSHTGLSQTRCLTVTLKHGKRFSFRILGVQPQSGQDQTEPVKMELIVANCGGADEPVVKAVIEDEDTQHLKDAAAARSL